MITNWQIILILASSAAIFGAGNIPKFIKSVSRGVKDIIKELELEQKNAKNEEENKNT